MKRNKISSAAGILLIILSLTVVAGSLLALDPPRKGEGKQACSSDVMAHCKMYLIGARHKIRSCLQEHRAELSATCRNFLARAQAFEMKMKATCGNDINNHCGSFQGQPDAMQACIRKSFSAFSNSCQDFLKKTRQGSGS